MGTGDQLIIIGNLLGAIVATLVAAVATRRVSPTFRPVAYVVGFFSTIYVMGYIVLLEWAHDPNPADGDQIILWSSIMRGVGIPVWPAVWTWVWVLLIREWQRVKRDISPIEERLLAAERGAQPRSHGIGDDVGARPTGGRSLQDLGDRLVDQRLR